MTLSLFYSSFYLRFNKLLYKQLLDFKTINWQFLSGQSELNCLHLMNQIVSPQSTWMLTFILSSGKLYRIITVCNVAANSYQCGVDEAVCGGPGLRRD